jgi:hypothetical protein
VYVTALSIHIVMDGYCTFPRSRLFSKKKAGAGFPKKEEGNSLFLGIPGEWDFRIKGTKKGNAQPSLHAPSPGPTLLPLLI